MILAYTLIGLVALQRLIEVIYAERNTRALLARGGIETGRAHYPLLMLLHLAWLATIALSLPNPPVIYWIPLAFFLLLQAARIWVIASLGPYWTTRIITLPGAALVKRGPYRFLRHPNYIVVAGEIATLPLVFGEIWVTLVFSVLNALMLTIRIRQEDKTLMPRRDLPG